MWIIYPKIIFACAWLADLSPNCSTLSVLLNFKNTSHRFYNNQWPSILINSNKIFNVLLCFKGIRCNKLEIDFNIGGNRLWLAKWCKIHKVYIHSHSRLLLLFTNIFIHIQQQVYIQEIYLFTFNDIFLIHEYIYSHLRDVSFTFTGLHSFTFTIQIFIQHRAIFIQHFLRNICAHR